MSKYTIKKSISFAGETIHIFDLETGDIFTEVETNRHYQEYIAWVQAGNTPDELVEELP